MTFERWTKLVDLYRAYTCRDDGFTECAVEDAFEAGWNSCRDHWGGMIYDETKKIGHMKDDF